MGKKKTKAIGKKSTTPPVVKAPAVQATGAGRGGNVPPPEHRWQPGQSGNPAGRPTAGASVREWINQLADRPVQDLEQILSDPNAPVVKKVAARLWADAASRACNAVGNPTAGPEFDRIMDRTEGRPSQHNHLTSDGSFVEEPTVIEKLVPQPGDDDGS